MKIKEDLCANQKSDKIIKDFMLKEIFWLQRFLKIIFCEYKGEKKEGINLAGARISMN